MPTDTEIIKTGLHTSRAVSSGEEDSRIGLLDLLLLLAGNQRLVLAIALAGGVSFAALGGLLPRLYTATAVILPPQQQHSAAGAMMGQLGALAGVGGADLSLKTPGEYYIGLLSSRTIADALVERFKLDQLYGTDRHSDTLKKLANRTHFATGKDTLIRISVDDADAGRSAELANAYVDQIYVQTGRLATTEASQRRLFFDRQLEQERIALRGAELNLRGVQEHTGLLELSSQTEVLIRASAELQAEIAGREIALENLRSGATNQNPEVQRRQTELDSMRAHLRHLQQGEAKARPSNLLTTASQLPAVGLQYLQGLRELKYHESLFEMLTNQFEAAKIDEAKEAPVIQVVDRATPPDKRNGLSVPVMSVIGIALCTFLACFLIFLGHAIGGPEDSAKLAALRQMVSGFGRTGER